MLEVKNLSFSLYPGDKLAIIGEEGNGKSTLLKAILGIGDYACITGSIDFKGSKIGYLRQSIGEEMGSQKVYDFLFQDIHDYYEKIHIFYRYLESMDMQDTILEQCIHTLSGGERVKIGVLKLLIEEYDIFFLDEPTNDLDIDSLEWLENFIYTISKPIVYISHDETLLSRTANRILHIEQIMKKTDCRYTLLKIDYNTYVEKRLREIDKQIQVAKSEKREFDKQQEKLRQIMQKVEYRQDTISRRDPHGAKVLKKKMHSLKAQEKKLDMREFTEIPDVEEGIHFFFEKVEMPKMKSILNMNIPELRIADKVLSKNIQLDVFGYMHVCIVGKNGSGKSTLIKEIYESLKHRVDIKLGYMPQNYEDVLKNDEYVLDFLCPDSDKEYIARVRKYLGNMNFTKEEMMGKIGDLSNGTKAKLFLVKFVLDECTVLLLDEPTRNVSPLSNPVIRRELCNYKGTIISVSHDRKYIDEVIDCLYTLTPNGLIKER